MTQSDYMCYDTNNFSHEVLKMKRCISNILIVLLLACATMPALSTEENITQQAVLDARSDAKTDINKPLWFSLGCFFGPIAYAASFTRTPAVPTQRLVGKSTEYLNVYSEEYRQKRKSLQSTYTTIGCLTGALISTAGCLVFIVSDPERTPRQTLGIVIYSIAEVLASLSD